MLLEFERPDRFDAPGCRCQTAIHAALAAGNDQRAALAARLARRQHFLGSARPDGFAAASSSVRRERPAGRRRRRLERELDARVPRGLPGCALPADRAPARTCGRTGGAAARATARARLAGGARRESGEPGAARPRRPVELPAERQLLDRPRGTRRGPHARLVPRDRDARAARPDQGRRPGLRARGVAGRAPLSRDREAPAPRGLLPPSLPESAAGPRGDRARGKRGLPDLRHLHLRGTPRRWRADAVGHPVRARRISALRGRGLALTGLGLVGRRAGQSNESVWLYAFGATAAAQSAIFE